VTSGIEWISRCQSIAEATRTTVRDKNGRIGLDAELVGNSAELLYRDLIITVASFPLLECEVKMMTSSPQRRGSTFDATIYAPNDIRSKWIPASAGMTSDRVLELRTRRAITS